MDPDDLSLGATQVSPPDEQAAGSDFSTADLGSHVRSYLVELIGQTPGTTYKLGDTAVIGRLPECEIVIKSGEISRKHAKITRISPDRYVLIDLGSSNGTLVNGLRVVEHRLRFGDRISVGRTLLLFTHHDDLEDRVVHQQKMESLGRLAGGVAHDFNNLLGAVLANLSVVLSMDSTLTLADQDVRDTLKDIEAASRLAAELTQQLLSFARRGSYEEAPVDFSQLTRSALGVIARTFGPEITVSAHVEDGQFVIGDRSQLHQVLMNLMINARDSLQGRGNIGISLRGATAEAIDPSGPLRGACTVLAIHDSGPGLDQEAQRRVFEPFFTTRTLGQGTGLGLATVYGLIRNHGGEISVESAIGKGSTFRVLLPATWAEPIRESGTVAEDTGPPVQTILLVDDDHLFIRSTQRILQQGGYTAILASGGREALELYRKIHAGVDLVMIDLMMPSMSGEQLCRALFEVNPAARILTIGSAQEAAKLRQALGVETIGLLHKPFERPELERAIAMTVNRGEGA
ncbi:MAG: response regulator [Deltaproteobacteria bacterium]|nr:response regulator [Deltaproteobacteria bacterium]